MGAYRNALCEEGNREDLLWALKRAWRDIDRLQEALQKIATSEFINYENNSPDSYGTGVTDGHRYCAKIARAALEVSDASLEM